MYKKKILYIGGGVFFNLVVDIYIINNEVIEGEFFIVLCFIIEYFKWVIVVFFNIDENLKI